MNFLEHLWKHDNVKKSKRNMIDEIIDIIGESGIRELNAKKDKNGKSIFSGTTGVDLKELLTGYAKTSKKPMKGVRVLSSKKDAIENYRARRDYNKERDKDKNRREAKDKQITANVRHNLPSRRGLKDDPTGRFNFPFQEEGIEPTYDDLKDNESTDARTRQLAEESKRTDWTKYIQKSEKDIPYLLWTEENLPKSKKRTLKNIPFIIDSLREIRRKENAIQIDALIEVLGKRTSQSNRDTSETQDVYAKTGEQGTAQIRPYTDQENVLNALLDIVQYGHDYATKKDSQGNSIKRQVQELDVLSVKFLVKLSDSIYYGKKSINPKIIERIKTTEDLLPNFIQFLKTQKKSLPRRASMKATIGRLSTKKRGRGRIIALLINNPEEYVFDKDDYAEDLSKINKILSDNIKEFNETVEPLVYQGTYDLNQFHNKIESEYYTAEPRELRGRSKTEYVGDLMSKLIKSIEDDASAMQKTQKAKIALIKIGTQNGKSSTLNNDDYQNAIENYKYIKDSSYWKTYSKGTSDIVESKKPNTVNELRTSRTSIEDKAKQRIKESVKMLEEQINDLTEMEEMAGNDSFAERKETLRNKINNLKERYPDMFEEE